MPDTSTTLRCPSCDAAIEVSELMSAQITAKLRGEVRAETDELRQRLERKQEGVAAAEAALREREAKVDDAVREALAEREKQLVERTRASARADLRVELEDGRAQLAEAKARLEKTQAESLELRKKERELEEREAKAAAEAREKDEALAAERATMQEERERLAADLRRELAAEGEAAVKEAAEAAAAKAVAEANGKHAAELAEQKEREQRLTASVKAAADREREMLAAQEKLAEEREQLDLEIKRQMAQERSKVREAALQEAEEKARLASTEQQIQADSLRRKVAELQQKLDQGSQQTQGEALEVELESILGRLFPRDAMEEVPKGVNGGDVLQRIYDDHGREAGLILWESKRTRNWSQPWLSKLRDDQRAAKAHVAVLVSIAMPPDVPHMGCCEEVWVCSPALVEATATAMRQSILAASRSEHATQNRHGKMESVYAYLASPEFAHRVSGIVESFQTMREDLDGEKRAFARQWAKREKQIERALSNTLGMHGDLQGLIGGTLHELDSAAVMRLDPAGLAATAPPPQERSVDELDLSTRARNALDAAGVTTFADLLATTAEALEAVGGVGAGTVEEIREKLQAEGMSLRADEAADRGLL